MPSFLSTPAFTSRRLSALALALCIAVLLFQQGARALPQATDALRFFNNFFVTGGYVVGGVGLWNTGSGTINMSQPDARHDCRAGRCRRAGGLSLLAGRDLRESRCRRHSRDRPTFNGVAAEHPRWDLPPPRGRRWTTACPLNGGSGNRSTRSEPMSSGFWTWTRSGRRVVNKEGGYPVSLPNNGTARTLGASLVVIYRHSEPGDAAERHRAVRRHVREAAAATLRQRIEGFYDAASVTGRITYIAGSAQSNLNEILRIDTDGDPATVPAGTASLFDGASGNAWDNVTRQTAP